MEEDLHLIVYALRAALSRNEWVVSAMQCAAVCCSALPCAAVCNMVHCVVKYVCAQGCSYLK